MTPFGDLAKANASIIGSGMLSEDIEYYDAPVPVWLKLKAFVRRQPVDALEGFLKNEILVYIESALVPEPNLQEDAIKLETPSGIQPEVYTVQEATPGGPGLWKLRCSK